MFKEIKVSGAGTRDFQILFDGERIPQIDEHILGGSVSVQVDSRFAVLHLGIFAQNVVVENPEWQTIRVDPYRPESPDSNVLS